MRFAFFAAITILGFAAGLGGGYLWQQYANPDVQLQRATQLGDAAQPLPDFQLQDQDRRPFTQAQFRGRWTLVFFGYTHCPDICPLTLTEVKGLYKRLAETPYQKDTQIVFVSVDPKRDTPEFLKRYVQHFHSSFMGVTGSQEQLNRLTRALGIVYRYRGEGDDYLVDHSSSMLLVDPEVRLYATFSAPHEAKVLAHDYIAIRDIAS
ncbi:MAG: SCO family protein [Acidiferrobacterales bacterium]